MTRVKMAEESQQMKRMKQVEGWFSRVEAIETEANELIIESTQEIEKKCPKNCMSSYKLGKKVGRVKDKVVALKSKGVFEEVANRLPSAPVDERPSEPTVGLESMFDEVWRYIEDEQVRIIGLYGVGGVGKTTLLIEINNKLINTSLGFDIVIWVLVSRNRDLKNVQNDIGKKIGLHNEIWANKRQEDKAIDIFGVLKKKKFVLLLDDIWERLDLSKVGVPIQNTQNKSKIVLTTRSKDVCGRMEADTKIKVKFLAPEKAWDLFRKKVGEDTLNFHPEIPELAKNVAKECKGLPLALITIGRAMACKTTLQEWHHASQVLKKFAAEFSGMGDEVYPLLKFSYDSLQSDKYRSCFLYCSLFSEDYLISKEKLIEYWIGEGFLDGFNDVNEGYDIISTLIHACLLEEDSRENIRNFKVIPEMSGSVKMHDVIRDMALWIACECGKVEDSFWVQARASFKKAHEIGKWKGVGRKSLMHNQIEELTETPSSPNIFTLLLNHNQLKMITHGYFQNMPNLKVLDLSHNYPLEELPVEISELVSLQYLNLSWTNIRELPIEYKNLIDLKYLNLDDTFQLNIIPQGLLSSFKKLRVLKMYNCHSSCLLEEDSVLSGQFETFMKEVESLKELNHFSLSIRTTSTLSCVLRSPKILSCTKLLSLFLMEDLKYQDMSFLQSMKCIHQLIFQVCDDLECLKVEKASSEIIISHPLCFHSLRNVYIHGCMNLKEVTWLVFAPNLEILTIEVCNRMEEVICGNKSGEASGAGEREDLFAKLKELNLVALPQLKSIYPYALTFPSLKFVTVLRCPNLKKLPLNSDSAKGCIVDIMGNKKWWNELEWESEATQNAFLPFFKSQ